MKRLLKSAAVLVFWSMSGCKAGWYINLIAPDAIRQSKGYFDELRQRQVDQLLQSFDPREEKERLRGELGKIVSLVPQQEPLGVETLGATAECRGTGVCTKLITLEYKYPDRWILFQVEVSNQSGHYAITDLTVQQESEPLESIEQFSFRGKGWLHYFMLLLALLSVGVAIYALVVCIRTPIRKRKWLWAIVTILGVVKVGID